MTCGIIHLRAPRDLLGKYRHEIATVDALLRASPPRGASSPSAYEAMQARAPEFFKIEILRVDVAPGETPTEQRVQLVALISQVPPIGERCQAQ